MYVIFIRKMKKIYLLLFLQLCFSSSISAQESFGSISGIVTDAETGEAIPFVNVSLDVGGNTVGTATDFDGVYEIDSIPFGTYVVTFSQVGMQANKIEGLVIGTDNKSVKLDVQIQSMSGFETIEVISVTIPMVNTIETRTGVFIYRTRSGRFVPHTIF